MILVSGLIPSTVVPINMNIHAVFSARIGEKIIQRWKPTSKHEFDHKHDEDAIAHVRMLLKFEDYDSICVCQHHARYGLTVFAVHKNDLTILATMTNPYKKKSAIVISRAIRDVKSWLKTLRATV